MLLISKKHKFIFIHVFKTAGMSIKAALEPHVQNPLLRKFDPYYRRVFRRSLLERSDFHPHITASELIGEIGHQAFSSYFTFGFVRNPWDWQVSLYEFTRQNPNHHQHELIKSFKGFDAYIQWRFESKGRLQKDWFYSDGGDRLVNFIGKFENLQEDFAYVCNCIGVQAALPHKNKSKRQDYRAYYSAEARRLVEKHYQADIELFGYTFDA